MFRLQALETTMLVFGQPCTVSWSSILKWYDRCHASTMNYNVEIINSCSYADNSASIRIHGPKGGAVPWSAGTRASGRRCRPLPAAGGRTVPHKSQLGLPTGYRRRTLAKLDALIAKAEEDQAERLRTVERLAAAKKV